MLEVLLRHTFHGAEIAIAKHQWSQRSLSVTRPVCTQLKSSRNTEGQRQDSDISEFSLEEALIVGMPSNRHATILI